MSHILSLYWEKCTCYYWECIHFKVSLGSLRLDFFTCFGKCWQVKFSCSVGRWFWIFKVKYSQLFHTYIFFSFFFLVFEDWLYALWGFFCIVVLSYPPTADIGEVPVLCVYGWPVPFSMMCPLHGFMAVTWTLLVFSLCRYMKYLYPYECEKRGLSSPGELQAAIDSNRREGRRQSYGSAIFNYSPVGTPTLLSAPKLHLSHLPMPLHNSSHMAQVPAIKKGKKC